MNVDQPYREVEISTSERLLLFSSLETAEAMIRDDSGQETVIAFQAATGVFARRAAGNVVRLSDVYRTFAGCIVTHNYPDGTSFTPEDVGTACAAQVLKLRAVSTHFTYSLRPGGRRQWTEQYWRMTLEPLYVQTINLVFREFLQREHQGLQDRAASNALILHETWRRIAHTGEIEYNRAEVSQ